MDCSLDQIPDGIEPIVGYRMWIYTLLHGGAQLHSLTDPATGWDEAGSRWIVSSCKSPDSPSWHVAPGADCTCGFYSVKTLIQLRKMAAVHPLGDTVFGRIELAGTIVEHEYGYRAERARIALLIPIQGTEPDVVRLAGRLQLPVGISVPAISTRVFFKSPPNDPSSPRRRVKDWVRNEAA
jgi:hypothetical protein